MVTLWRASALRARAASVIAWGANDEGQLGNGGLGSRRARRASIRMPFVSSQSRWPGSPEVVQISAAGRHVLRWQGRHACTPGDPASTIIAEDPKKPGVATVPSASPAWRTSFQVAAARDHNLVLTRDGDV